MRSRVSGRAPPSPARTRLTVAVDTFARSATSAIVAVTTRASVARAVDGVDDRHLFAACLASGEHRQVALQLLELCAATHQPVEVDGIQLASLVRPATAAAVEDRER